MKVFVATKQGQGEREDDLFLGVEGELIRVAFGACCDPRCRCDRMVLGLASGLPSTTFTVAALPGLTERTYGDLFRASLEAIEFEDTLDADRVVKQYLRWHVDTAAAQPQSEVFRVFVNPDMCPDHSRQLIPS